MSWNVHKSLLLSLTYRKFTASTLSKPINFTVFIRIASNLEGFRNFPGFLLADQLEKLFKYCLCSMIFEQTYLHDENDIGTIEVSPDINNCMHESAGIILRRNIPVRLRQNKKGK
jgi:hypothetical protein